MRDLVLHGFIEDFAKHTGFDPKDVARAFEAFAASSILRKYHHFDSADIENDVLVGGSGDGGVDGISILINGRPIRSREDVDFFKERLGHLDVDFVFVQAKSSSEFSSSEIGHFSYGVQNFFSGDDVDRTLNDDVLDLQEVSRYVSRTAYT